MPTTLTQNVAMLFFLSQEGKFWPLQNNDTAKSTQDWLKDNSECPKMVLARTQLTISEPKNQSLSNLLELGMSTMLLNQL